MSLPTTTTPDAAHDREARIDREQLWSNAFLFAGPALAFAAAVLAGR